MKYYLSGCRHIIYLVIFMLWPLDNEVAANKRCHFPAKKIRFVMQFRTCIHVSLTNFQFCWHCKLAHDYIVVSYVAMPTELKVS